jgi:predicted SPOUT superfamily RNA methylase MTH1
VKFKYSDKIKFEIELLNKVLNNFNMPSVLENNYFLIDKELTFEKCLKFKLFNPLKNHITLNFIFSDEGIEIDIDKLPEAIEWVFSESEESFEDISTLIKDLFSCYALLENYGEHFTRLSLYDSDGNSKRTFEYREGFGFKRKRSDKLFFPFID